MTKPPSSTPKQSSPSDPAEGISVIPPFKPVNAVHLFFANEKIQSKIFYFYFYFFSSALVIGAELLAMSFNPSNRMDPHAAAERAVSVIGFGYDLTADIRLSACKPGPSGSGLIEIQRSSTRDLVLPAGVVVPNVSTSIKCDKGERTRFRSDALSFSQVISPRLISFEFPLFE